MNAEKKFYRTMIAALLAVVFVMMTAHVFGGATGSLDSPSGGTMFDLNAVFDATTTNMQFPPQGGLGTARFTVSASTNPAVNVMFQGVVTNVDPQWGGVASVTCQRSAAWTAGDARVWLEGKGSGDANWTACDHVTIFFGEAQ